MYNLDGKFVTGFEPIHKAEHSLIVIICLYLVMGCAIDGDGPDILIGLAAALDPYARIGFFCHTGECDRLQRFIFALCESTFSIHYTAFTTERYDSLSILE